MRSCRSDDFFSRIFWILVVPRNIPLRLNLSNTPRYPDPSINLSLWDDEDRRGVEATALEMKTLCSAIKERAIR
jgi:hypothetical protein